MSFILWTVSWDACVQVCDDLQHSWAAGGAHPPYRGLQGTVTCTMKARGRSVSRKIDGPYGTVLICPTNIGFLYLFPALQEQVEVSTQKLKP